MSSGRVARVVLPALGLGVVVGVVVGVLAGVVWEAVWRPPTGVYFQGDFYLDERGLTEHFSGTGWFVLVGAGAGLLLGAVLTVVWRSAVLLALAGASLAAVVATGVMTVVGTRLGPGDPAARAADQADYAPGVLDLHVTAWPAYAAVLVGALAGLLAVLGLLRLASSSRHEGDRPADMIAS